MGRTHEILQIVNDDHVRVHESLMEYLVASFIIDVFFLMLRRHTNDHDNNILQILQNCFRFPFLKYRTTIYSLFNHDITLNFIFSVFTSECNLIFDKILEWNFKFLSFHYCYISERKRNLIHTTHKTTIF